MSDVLSQMTIVFNSILSMFGDLIETINSNALIYVPVYASLLGGLIVIAMFIVRKFGVRGISSIGRRRGRR